MTLQTKTLLPVLTLLWVLRAVPAAAQDVESAATLQSEPESISPGADESGAPPSKKSASGIEYRSGGVGKEQRDALLLVTKRYTLKIVLAKKDLAFVFDAKIRILDATGKAIIEADDAGPLFFAKLPAGKYKVVATAYGQTTEQSVSVTAGKQTAISVTC